MVEGPGTTNNGKRARALVGSRVAGISGPAAKGVAVAVRGNTLFEVLTLGKELFLFFRKDASTATTLPKNPFTIAAAASTKAAEAADESDSPETAVRLHFGMSGSIHIAGPDPRNAATKKLTIGLHFFGGARFRAFGATCGATSARAAREKHRKARSRDVCALDQVWDENAAFEALRTSAPTVDVATAILNQEVSPGTGNIIKNEALHFAGVLPSTAVGLLDDAALLRVIRECRKYSRAWQRAGRAPAKTIYDKTICGSCGGPVMMRRLGPGSGRPTFFCQQCVDNGGPPARGASGRKRKRPGSTVAAGGPPPPPPPAPPPAGSCKAHPNASKLSRVRKPGANTGRLFFSCRVRSCKHFEWGDKAFGPCKCKRTAGLQICKKNGANTGRWFFTCRKRQCDHFSWCGANTVESLFGELLSPLT